MKKYLHHLDYDVDRALLLQEAKKAKLDSKPYAHTPGSEFMFNGWRIGHYTSNYIEKIMKDFGVSGKPRFYWMEPFTRIPTHTDDGTECSLNFVLTENAAPIIIDGETYCYRNVLLNTTVPHSVVNNEHERIMLKISIFDKTYEEVLSNIPLNLLSSTGA